VVSVSVPGGRQRARAALRCPYCRDEVAQDDALACADRTCGALYHSECWDECRSGYGGCAVYGCCSTESRSLSRAGFLLRWLKLLLAVTLFPPRAVQALRNPRHAHVVDACRQRAEEAQVRLWQSRAGDALKGIAIVLTFVGMWAFFRADPTLIYFPQEPLEVLGFFSLIPLLLLFATFGAAYGGQLLVEIARAALAGELSALAAADRGGYLTRMLRSSTKS
jgi:hypothetical protein